MGWVRANKAFTASGSLRRGCKPEKVTAATQRRGKMRYWCSPAAEKRIAKAWRRDHESTLDFGDKPAVVVDDDNQGAFNFDGMGSVSKSSKRRQILVGKKVATTKGGKLRTGCRRRKDGKFVCDKATLEKSKAFRDLKIVTFKDGRSVAFRKTK